MPLNYLPLTAEEILHHCGVLRISVDQYEKLDESELNRLFRKTKLRTHPDQNKTVMDQVRHAFDKSYDAILRRKPSRAIKKVEEEIAKVKETLRELQADMAEVLSAPNVKHEELLQLRVKLNEDVKRKKQLEYEQRLLERFLKELVDQFNISYQHINKKRFSPTSKSQDEIIANISSHEKDSKIKSAWKKAYADAHKEILAGEAINILPDAFKPENIAESLQYLKNRLQSLTFDLSMSEKEIARKRNTIKEHASQIKVAEEMEVQARTPQMRQAHGVGEETLKEDIADLEKQRDEIQKYIKENAEVLVLQRAKMLEESQIASTFRQYDMLSDYAASSSSPFAAASSFTIDDMVNESASHFSGSSSSFAAAAAAAPSSALEESAAPAAPLTEAERLKTVLAKEEKSLEELQSSLQPEQDSLAKIEEELQAKENASKDLIYRDEKANTRRVDVLGEVANEFLVREFERNYQPLFGTINHYQDWKKNFHKNNNRYPTHKETIAWLNDLKNKNDNSIRETWNKANAAWSTANESYNKQSYQSDIASTRSYIDTLQRYAIQKSKIDAHLLNINKQQDKVTKIREQIAAAELPQEEKKEDVPAGPSVTSGRLESVDVEPPPFSAVDYEAFKIIYTAMRESQYFQFARSDFLEKLEKDLPLTNLSIEQKAAKMPAFFQMVQARSVNQGRTTQALILLNKYRLIAHQNNSNILTFLKAEDNRVALFNDISRWSVETSWFGKTKNPQYEFTKVNIENQIILDPSSRTAKIWGRLKDFESISLVVVPSPSKK